MQTKKQRIVVWLEPDAVEQLDRYAENLAKIKDTEKPESGRKKSRSKAARRAILDGLGWSGMQL